MQDQYLSCQRQAYYEKDSLEASYELNESLSWKDQYFSKTLEVNLGNRIPQDIFDQFMQGDKGTSDLHSSHRKNMGCEEVEQCNDLGKKKFWKLVLNTARIQTPQSGRCTCSKNIL